MAKTDKCIFVLYFRFSPPTIDIVTPVAPIESVPDVTNNRFANFNLVFRALMKDVVIYISSAFRGKVKLIVNTWTPFASALLLSSRSFYQKTLILSILF